MEKAGWVVLVAGAHASAMGLLGWRVAPLISAQPAEARPVALVPTAPRAMGHLPEVEARFALTVHQSAGEAVLQLAALPARDAYPQLRMAVAPEPARMVSAPAPSRTAAPVVMAKVEPAFPPLPDTAAQEALRNMLCDRMSAHQDAACAGAPAPSETYATAQRRYVSAEVRVEPETAPAFFTDARWRSGASLEPTEAGTAVRYMAYMPRTSRSTGPTPRIQTSRADGPAPIVFR